MRYITGNIMDLLGRPDAICITTNGFTTSRGKAVMGMGIAKQMAERFPELPGTLGHRIRENGNQVQLLMQYSKTRLLSMPVKPVQKRISSLDEVVSHARDKYHVGSVVPGFHCVADAEIIRKSCDELLYLASRAGYNHVVLPIPGCGAGELSYNRDGVREICETMLDDRFFMCSFQQSDFRR